MAKFWSDLQTQNLATCTWLPNTQVANGGKLPKKPGGYNCNHIPKALEQYPTGLPNSQPSNEAPMSGPPQVPITLEADSSAERKEKKWVEDREGKPRTAKLLQNSTHNATLTQQWTCCKDMGWQLTHKLTKNTTGQCQPKGSHNHTMYDCCKRYGTHQMLNKMLIDSQANTYKNATDQSSSWPYTM